MAWTDGYLSASFRGVPFLVERAGQQGGRRIVEDELPERDDSYFQDLGLKNKTFSLTGYLVGEDYYTQRTKLIEALEKPGTGPLVHPYRGEYEVWCADYSISEQTSEGRMCRFDITFKRVSDGTFLIVGQDWRIDALEKKQSFLEKLDAAFGAVYDVASKPANILQDAMNSVNKALDYVEKAKQIAGTYDTFQRNLSTLRGKVIEFTLQAEFISQKIGEIIDFGSDPSTPIDDTLAASDLLAASVTGTTADVLSSGPLGKNQYNELGALTGFDDLDLTAYPSIADEDPNYPVTQIKKLVARKALASRVSLIIGMDLDSVQAADSVLADTHLQISKIEADENADTDLVGAARDLRAVVEAIISNRLATLNQLNALDLPEWEPAIVTAYSLYEDTERSSELAALNDIVHPGFLPGERLRVYAN